MTDFLAAPWSWPRSVTSVLLTPSDEEPLTLDEGKLRAGLDWATGDPRDALMRGFIKAARQKVEVDTGLALLRQTRRITIAIDPGTTFVLPLPMHALPLLEITSPAGLRTRPDVLWPAVAAAPPDRAAVVHTLAGPALSIPGATSGTWEIVSGWPDAATLAAEAPLLVHAVGLLVAHYATLGRDLAGVGHLAYTVPQGYDDAIEPFRLMWVI